MPIIGTAAWSIPSTVADQFPEEGSGLTRYATVFNGVEINSTFYRRHRSSTFARWASSVPQEFRFAVKLPQEITHKLEMKNIAEPFRVFLDDLSPLGAKLGPLLCQLPPQLAFESESVETAFAAMRAVHAGAIVIEARHGSWASDDALAMLRKHGVERVAADPERVWQIEDLPQPLTYLRLHGKPKVYYDSYSKAEIEAFLALLGENSWCIFDNTASGAAPVNALSMLKKAQAANR